MPSGGSSDETYYIKTVFVIVSVVLCQDVCSIFVDAATTREIVFTSTRDGNKEIYVMNADGSKQVNLTRHRADDFGATWSPDRTQILFVSDRTARVRDLYLMDADGTNVRRVFRRINTESSQHGLRWSRSRM